MDAENGAPRAAESSRTGRRTAAAMAAALTFPLVAAVPAVAQAPGGKQVAATQIGGDGFAGASASAAAHATERGAAQRKRSGKKVTAIGDGFTPSATGSQSPIGGGVEFFVNTDITFSTTSSASGAMSEASMTASVDDVSTVNGGVEPVHLNDAFDGYNSLAVHVGENPPASRPGSGDPAFTFYNRNGAPTIACEGAETQFNEQVVGDLRLSRRVWVGADAPVARTLDVVRNAGAAPVTVTLYKTGNLGSDNGTRTTGTSSGDLVADTGDAWVTTFQEFSGTTSSDPRLGHVLQGDGQSELNSVYFADGDDNPWWTYKLTLAPGETRIVANYVVVEANKPAAAAGAAALAAEPLTDCMTDEEVGQLANFDIDAPVLRLPATRTVQATEADGAVVTFEATAADAHDGALPVTCVPASGSRFPVGTTTVECTARDAVGNVARGSFDVVVKAPVPATPPATPTPPRTPAPAPPRAVAPVSTPWLARLTLGPRCVTPVGGRLPRLVARYRLSADARVTYQLQTRAMKRVWTSCPEPSAGGRGIAPPPPPRRWRTLLTATRTEVVGNHAVAFLRRSLGSARARAAAAEETLPVLGRAGLAPGSYRLVITARNDKATRRIVRNFIVLPPAAD